MRVCEEYGDGGSVVGKTKREGNASGGDQEAGARCSYVRRGCCDLRDVRVLGVLCDWDVLGGLRVGRLSGVAVVAVLAVLRDRLFFEVRRLVEDDEDDPDDDPDDTRFRVADVFAPIHCFSVVHPVHLPSIGPGIPDIPPDIPGIIFCIRNNGAIAVFPIACTHCRIRCISRRNDTTRSFHCR